MRYARGTWAYYANATYLPEILVIQDRSSHYIGPYYDNFRIVTVYGWADVHAYDQTRPGDLYTSVQWHILAAKHASSLGVCGSDIWMTNQIMGTFSVGRANSAMSYACATA